MASPTLPSLLHFSNCPQTSKRARVTAWAAGNERRPWWGPIFHAAFTGDQVGSEVRKTADTFEEEAKEVGSPAEMRFSALTAEKARVLRREMRATETWHDAMYHSAIASRLASPDQA